MSSVINFIKSLPVAEANDNLANDSAYVKKSSNLVNDALQKGSDIMQLENGDIVITEVKMVTYKYIWNDEAKKFERATSGSKVKKRRKSKAKLETHAA